MTPRHPLSRPCRFLQPTAYRLLLTVFLLLITHHSLLITAHAQSATATLNGTVEDQTGAVIPGVGITIQNSATSFERQVTSNGSGSFAIPLLPPGTYTVTARRDGFTPVEIGNVVLNVGDQKALQIQLKAGSVSETVQVTNDASLIDESPAVGTVVDRQFVENLPLNGRSFQALIALTPGVVQTKSSGSNPGQFSVNGQRADANYFTVDGVSANIGHSTFNGAIGSSGGSVPGLTAVGGTNNLISIDALQEFKIQTSTYSPEFGRSPGGQISLVTRSGTNEFHGTLFEYFRNDALDANDWFANSRGLKRPPLRQNNFGGVFGGPILLPRFGEGGRQPGYNGRNRTFFFFSYEGQRVRQPQVGITSVPSRLARQSALPQVKPFFDGFPLPTGPDPAGGLGNGLAEFAASYSNSSTLDATSIRVDHTVSGRMTFFGRYNHAPSSSISRRTTVLSNLNPARFTTDTATVGSIFTFSPRVSNDFRANWSRNRLTSSFTLDDFGGAVAPPESILFPRYASPEDSQFQFSLGAIALVQGAVSKHLQRQINLVDGFSVLAGNHQLKFGFDYRRLSPIYNPFRHTVNYFTGGITNALQSRSNLTVLTFSDGPFYPVFHNFSAYAQDTWKVRPRLTLSYGLRWELSPAPKEARGRDSYTVVGVDNPATMTLAPQGTPLYKTTYKNFAPRIGMAYQLFERQGWSTTLRAGFGIFYDLGNGDAGGGFGGYPFDVRANLVNSSIPIDLASTQPPAVRANPLTPPYAGQLLAFDPDLKLPRTWQMSVGLEQSLGKNQTISASYVGAVGRNLLLKDSLFGVNPNFTGFVIVERNAATSDYHALQVQFQRRLSRGLQALASYTWAHSLDYASDNATINGSVLRVDPRTNRGPSDFDVRHAFNTAVTYSFPKPPGGPVVGALLGNWSLDTIFNTRTATPVNVITGVDVLGLGGFASTASRPDLLPGVPLYVDDPTTGGGRRINRNAFAIPTGRQGTLGRNALRGFSIYQLDLGVRRLFKFTERVNLQFKAEMFNLLNHPNFGDPNGRLNSGATPDPTFGRSTVMLGRSLGAGTSGGGLSPLYQIGGPRSIQLALKLQF